MHLTFYPPAFRYFRIVCSLVAIALFSSGCSPASNAQAEPPPFPDLSAYDSNRLLPYYLGVHTNPQICLHRWTNILAMTIVHNQANVVSVYYVGEQGQNYSHRNRWYGINGSQSRNLNPGHLVELRTQLNRLPATNATPPINQLVLLSFRSGTNWVTHTYDNVHRPQALQAILDIIGERREDWEAHVSPSP